MSQQGTAAPLFLNLEKFQEFLENAPCLSRTVAILNGKLFRALDVDEADDSHAPDLVTILYDKRPPKASLYVYSSNDLGYSQIYKKLNGDYNLYFPDLIREPLSYGNGNLLLNCQMYALRDACILEEELRFDEANLKNALNDLGLYEDLANLVAGYARPSSEIIPEPGAAMKFALNPLFRKEILPFNKAIFKNLLLSHKENPVLQQEGPLDRQEAVRSYGGSIFD